MQTFCCSSGVHDVVENVSLQLFFQLLFIRKVQFDKVNSFVGKILSRACTSYGRPHFHLSSQRFFHDKAADKPACAGNKNFTHNYDWQKASVIPQFYPTPKVLCRLQR